MADGYVQLAPDQTGKKADVSELTRSDGTVVERQRAVLGDATNPAALQSVDPQGNAAVVDGAAGDLQRHILIELRVISTILAAGFSLDADSIRSNYSGD